MWRVPESNKTSKGKLVTITGTLGDSCRTLTPFQQQQQQQPKLERNSEVGKVKHLQLSYEAVQDKVGGLNFYTKLTKQNTLL